MNKAIRIIILVFIVGTIVGLIFYNITYTPPISSEVWDEETTIGNAETATKHYVQYSDFGCPYCDVFSRITVQNEKEFNKFLDENNILFEIRLTETIYDSVKSDISRDGAIATYCAKREGKFIDYYHAGVMQLYKDYHSKGIGDSKTSPQIKDMPSDFWLKIGHNIGLGDNFDSCVKNKETLAEVQENTVRAGKYIQGLPFFDFNGNTQAGFDNTWGWDEVLVYLNSGLKKK